MMYPARFRPDLPRSSASLAGLRQLLGWAVASALLAVILAAHLYVPWANSSLPLGSVGLVALALLGGTLLLGRWLRLAPLQAVAPRVDHPWVWLVAIIAVGILLRVLFTLWVQPVQMADQHDYWLNARTLAEGGGYRHVWPDGTVYFAWRPPGTSLALAALVRLLGPEPWVPLVANCLAFGGTAVLLYAAGRALVGGRLALVAVALLTVFPSSIARAGLAESEHLALLYYTAAFWALLLTERRLWAALLAGLFLGMLTLTKPSYQLVPLAVAAFLVLTGTNWMRMARCMALLLAGMAVVIAPWTIRNHSVGVPVLISTNGGDVFYRANNPLANGGYVASGARSLAPYRFDEALWNRTGYEWGIEWIRENPKDFGALALRKQGLFLGGGGESMRVVGGDYGRIDGPVLDGLVLGSVAFWMGLWSMAAVGAVNHRRRFASDPRLLLATLLILYPVAIHSVFESAGRHHLPMSGLLMLIAVLSLAEGKGDVPPAGRRGTYRSHRAGAWTAR